MYYPPPYKQPDIQRISSLIHKDVKIVNFFDVANSHNIMGSDVVLGSGNIPYVTAGIGNNSIAGYVDYKDSTALEEAKTIMIGGKTMVITYQPKAYLSNDSHNLVIKPKDGKGDEDAMLYVVAALYKSVGHKYYWGDSISKAKIQSDIVTLPMTSEGVPNYIAMAAIIRKEKIKVRRRLQKWVDHELATIGCRL